MLFNWFITDWYKLYLDQTKHPKAQKTVKSQAKEGDPTI